MPGKFIVGRSLDLPARGFNNAPVPVPAAPGDPAGFVQIPALQYEIQQSSGFIHKRSQIALGTNVKTHRNFRWLPWMPGVISYVPALGDPVLTGPFTGCWVVKFTMNGSDWIGHIGTNLTATDPLTIAVKAHWAAAVQAGAIANEVGFSPVARAPLTGWTAAPTWYALIDPVAGPFTVTLTKPLVGVGPQKETIHSVLTEQWLAVP